MIVEVVDHCRIQFHLAGLATPLIRSQVFPWRYRIIAGRKLRRQWNDPRFLQGVEATLTQRIIAVIILPGVKVQVFVGYLKWPVR